MSSAISTYQVLDDRLAISDSVNFGVAVGGQSINQQRFTTQALSSSSVSVNCLVPSLQTIIDRHVLLRTTYQFTLTGVVAAGGATLLTLGTNWAFKAFPFSQMVNTLSAQINNTNVNQNYRDVLSAVLRQMSPVALQHYNDLTPTQLDYFFDLESSSGNTRSPFNSIENALETINPRAAWVLDTITGNTNGAGAKTIVITATFTEPIFVSPFVFGDQVGQHNSGLSGVSAINFNFNMMEGARAMNWYASHAGDTLTAVAALPLSAEILMTFISPKPSQQIPLTCCLPYYELNCYKTSVTAAAAAPTGSEFQITTSIVSPNCIPDKVYLEVRPQQPAALAGLAISDFRFPIKSVNITWNTQSGILGNATQQELYLMSKRGGLAQDYLSWKGKATAVGDGTAQIYLTGGMLCLDFNEVIPIMEQYYSSSSLGQWTFQVTLTCINNTGVASPLVDVNTIFFQSGVFQSTAGSSSQYVGVLSKDEVLRVAQEEPHLMTEHSRLVGGGIKSFLSSAIKSVSPKLKSFILNKAKEKLPELASALKGKLAEKGKYGQMAASAIGALGYGRPRTRGGVETGGAMTGGAYSMG